jgi:enoyl-CoA hydratase/carnithine racemase
MPTDQPATGPARPPGRDREEGLRVAGLPRVSITELADGAASQPVLDTGGRITEPLLAVRLDEDADQAVLERAADRTRESGRLLIGVASALPPARMAPLLDALDLTLALAGDIRQTVAVADPDDVAESLNAAATANPQASLILASVLRITPALGVHEALEVESLAYSTLLGGPEFGRWLAGRAERTKPPQAANPVLVRRDGAQLRITLNHPERRNAYGRDLRDALADALRVARFEPEITRVVLDGAGPCFCSGGDLDEFGTTPDPATAHFIRTRAGAAGLLPDLAARTEARVHGPCVGAGVELPAFAGTVVAAENATFRLPEVAMGLIPGAGGTVSLPRRIGRWRTLYLALSGLSLNAASALAWGLADRVAPGAPSPS